MNGTLYDVQSNVLMDQCTQEEALDHLRRWDGGRGWNGGRTVWLPIASDDPGAEWEDADSNFWRLT